MLHFVLFAALLHPQIVKRDAGGHVTVTATRAIEPIRIDGKLDERLYETTEAVSDFLQQEPNEGQRATERTEARVFFAHNSIYVSARCWESQPARRAANEMRRDTVQRRQNDQFAVLLDTFHDRRNAYLFYS